MKKSNEIWLNQIDKKNWKAYQESLKKDANEVWDYIVITAANEEQANEYREEINFRKSKKLLPNKTAFLVISDLEGKRIGSGGATINVLKHIKEKNLENFENLKILLIHSGGDSKRIPQYSNIGKLFMPIQRILPDGRSSNLFDELMISFSAIPEKMDPGILVLSGDVLLLFDYSQVSLKGESAISISVKTEAQIGERHGVFVADEDNTMKKFLHKKSKEILKENQAIDKNGFIQIDTGAIYFNIEVINKILQLISVENNINNEKLEKLVNEKTQISLYNDLVYVFAKEANLEEYKKQEAEGELNQELIESRKVIWEKLNNYSMKIIKVHPAKFIHLGTNKELIELIKVDTKENNLVNKKNSISSNVRK